MPLFSKQNTSTPLPSPPPPPPPPSLPSPLQPLTTDLQRTLLQILLQTLILLALLSLLTLSVTFSTCHHLGYEGFYPSAEIFFSIAISLVWFLPIYSIITVVSPILRRYSKSRNRDKRSLSTSSSLWKHGRRPLWLSYKERCLMITIPAVVTLALSTSTVVENAPGIETWQYGHSPYNEECFLWQPRPILTLALSLLALVETLITYLLDNKAQLQEQEQEQRKHERKHRHPQPTATCGNLLCLHRCVSTLTNSNLESPPPLSSIPPVQVPITYCSSFRPLRNLRVLATFTGTICIVTIFAMVSHDQYDLFGRFRNLLLPEILGMAFACGLWLVIVYDMFQPSSTRIAHHLRPKSRFFITFFPGCLLALWTVAETVRTMMDKAVVAGDRGWNSRLGYTISGAFFGGLMTVEAVMTFLFDRRRYNTARKVKAFQEQQELRRQEQQQRQLQLEQTNDDTTAAGIELGGSDGKFQESGLFEGKIEEV